MKLLYAALVALVLGAGTAVGGQPSQGDSIVVSPTITESVKPAQWRRYGYYPRYYGGYYPRYRSYYSYRPYYIDGGYFYYGPGGGGFYFGW
jgi:hypothetical protein